MSMAKIVITDKVKSIDFTQLKEKLMDPTEGKGWSKDECDTIELLYKDFLILMWMHPNEYIVPNKVIDEFWHAHILDTRKYHADCDLIFGEYLHHFPYFGLRGEEDKKDLEDTFSETKKLWIREFGYEMDRPLTESKISNEKVTQSNQHSASNWNNASCKGSCYSRH